MFSLNSLSSIEHKLVQSNATVKDMYFTLPYQTCAAFYWKAYEEL